jgi:hypothetical protein
MKETRIECAVRLEIGGLLPLRGHPGRYSIDAQARRAQAGSVSLDADRTHSQGPVQMHRRSCARPCGRILARLFDRFKTSGAPETILRAIKGDELACGLEPA